MNTLIIGVGTGRCGTKSLTKLLGIQEDTYASHERFGPRVRWNCPPNLWPYRLWLDTLRNDKDIVADIGFMWTPHIGTYLNWADKYDRKVRIIGLKRDVDETVNSYDKWKPNSDHWSYHGYRETLPDQWDHCYPEFDTDSKRKGIRLFWHRVYNIIENATDDERVRCFDTEDLNTEEGVRSILKFAGYNDPKIEVGIQFKAPALSSVDDDNIEW